MEENNKTTAVKRVGAAALILSAGIFCSRLLGYVREAVIAYQAGASLETDAYNAAFLLPDLMNYFLAGGTLSITFIPLFSAYLAKNEEEKGKRLFSLIATTMGAVLITAIIIMECFATQFVGLLFDFNADQIAKTVSMTRVVLPAQFFHYIGGLMMAVLMSHGKFLPSALSPLIYNLSIIIFGVILSPMMGMQGFAIGALIGSILGPFLLPYCFVRKHISYKPIIAFKDKEFIHYILLTLPLMLGVSLTTVDEWFGRILGSGMAEGSISLLNYARRLMLVPIAIVGQAAGQAALPFLSRLAAKKDYEGLAQNLNNTFRGVIILSLICSAFFIVLAEPSVALVYERGEFTHENTLKTALLLQFFSIGIIAWTLQTVAVRGYYAEQNTLKPMVITSVVTILSIPIYWLMAKYFGVEGLAISSTIGMTLQAVTVIAFYKHKNNFLSIRKILVAILQGSLLAILAGAGSYLGLKLCASLNLFSDGGTLSAFFTLAISGCLGLALVLPAARFICPDEFKGFFNKILRKLKKKKSTSEQAKI